MLRSRCVLCVALRFVYKLFIAYVCVTQRVVLLQRKALYQYLLSLIISPKSTSKVCVIMLCVRRSVVNRQIKHQRGGGAYVRK